MGTLEQAASNYTIQQGVDDSSTLINAFEAGSRWQKEQYKKILTLAFEAANECDNNGASDLCNEIKQELERLQD